MVRLGVHWRPLMAWQPIDLEQQIRRRQTVRRHAERRHHHFYQARLDSHFIPNFAVTPIRWVGERWIMSLIAVVIGLLVFVVLPSFASVFTGTDRSTVWLALALPTPAATAPAGHDDSRIGLIDGNYVPLAEAAAWTSIQVQSGQTLGQICASEGIKTGQLQALLQGLPNASRLGQLRPGDRVGLRRNDRGALTGMQLDDDLGERFLITLDDHGLPQAQALGGAVELRVRVASGQIEDSLFGAAEQAGLSDPMTLQLAKVFAYDIDFAQDLRVGDAFSVVLQERYRDGEKISGGDILAAAFVNRGKRYDALRFTPPGSNPEYYDRSGRSLRKAFIRTPVEFTRISSRFSSARKHPILGRTRAHHGVDYAAPSGTPVIAAADGRIVQSGWQNGYGNTVVIDHGRGHSTLYGHLSRIAGHGRRGNRVSQGSVIGYVGMTGLATGPHLHYEFRINGVHRDPLSVTMPPPPPLAAGLLAVFRRATAPLLAQLAEAEARHGTVAQR
ncbi:MAG: peptidase M23 [Lysobacterales bacterium CG02_land_8_20_14_3_00_62_12]|nr:MAG: peptidase M23 [Xanthomonadales bacterium CG02_land_8_20_14_3_00_62_12]